MRTKKILTLTIIAVLTLALVGCSNFSSLDSDGSGKLAMYLTDAPVNNIKHVYVTFDRVEIKREDGQWETLRDFDVSQGEGKFDLLEFRFKKGVLGDKKLQAGKYVGVRFIVAADSKSTNKYTESGKSYIVFADSNNTEKELFIPSGQQTGIKMNKNFEIKKDVITELTLDINVKELIHSAGKSSKVIMQPTQVFEIFAEHETGSIKGRVVNSKGTAIDLEGYDVVVDIIDSEGNVVKSTVTSTEVDKTTDPNTPAGSFLVRGLTEGTYTIEAYLADDDGNKNPNYTIGTAKDIKVNVGEVSTLDNNIVVEKKSSQ